MTVNANQVVNYLDIRQVHRNIATLDAEAAKLRVRGGVHRLIDAELTSSSASGMRLALQTLGLHDPSEEHV